MTLTVSTWHRKKPGKGWLVAGSLFRFVPNEHHRGFRWYVASSKRRPAGRTILRINLADGVDEPSLGREWVDFLLQQALRTGVRKIEVEEARPGQFHGAIRYGAHGKGHPFPFPAGATRAARRSQVEAQLQGCLKTEMRQETIPASELFAEVNRLYNLLKTGRY